MALSLENVIAESLCAHRANDRFVVPQMQNLVIDHLPAGQSPPCASCVAAAGVIAQQLRSVGLVAALPTVTLPGKPPKRS